MDQNRILALVDADPFEPFDIRTSDRRAYFVDHPNYLARSRDGRVVTYYTKEDDRAVTIDLHHVVSAEVAKRPPRSSVSDQT